MAVVQELLYDTTDNGRLLGCEGDVDADEGEKEEEEKGMPSQSKNNGCAANCVCLLWSVVCSVFSLAGWVVIQQLTIAKERHKVENKSITSKGVRQSSPPEY